MNQGIQDKLTHYFSAHAAIKYAKGEILTQAGEEPEGVSLLVEGSVEQFDITPEGNRVTVNVFKPPAFFPMSWAINHTPNIYFYAALTDVRLQRADAASTVTFLQANPDVMFDLLSRVYRGTDALLQRHVITAQGIAESRLIFELLIEAYRFGSELKGGQRLITAKQHTLAARSGLARETVNRELHKLENEKLLSLSKDGIELNIHKLEEKLAHTA